MSEGNWEDYNPSDYTGEGSPPPPIAPSFALAIPHTPWVPERAESSARLMAELGATSDDPAAFRVFSEREPNYVWSEKLWTWLSEIPVTHCVQLQDDVRVSPNFWRQLRAMVTARPNDVIGLETVHPLARHFGGKGWVTTSDGLVGVGYVLPRGLLKEFLEWRLSALKFGAIEKLTEDTTIGLWCLATGRKIYHPVPAIIDHDVSIGSTYGNDGHAHRRPLVRWNTVDSPTVARMAFPGFWGASDAEIPHLGRMYDASPFLLRQHLAEKPTIEQFNAWRGDNGKALARTVGMPANTSKNKVLICTITRGQVHHEYAQSIWRLIRGAHLMGCDFDLWDVYMGQSDVVRARSRAVNYFLTETDATHLFFVDADVAFMPTVLSGMLRANLGFVAAPYPNRDGVDLAAVRAAPPEVAPEAVAYKYNLRPLADGFHVDEAGIAEIAGVGLGCALLSREMLAQMTGEYEGELAFEDEVSPGRWVPSVALFQLMKDVRTGNYMSEDFSFEERWRAMGGRIYLYLGPGSPVHHFGEVCFKGEIEAFGLRRESR